MNAHSYKFSVARGTYNFDSLRYRTSNNYIIFNPCEEVRLSVQGKEEHELIFFNAYSHDD